MNKLNGTIIECCTAYGGGRQDPALHWKAIEDHGFKVFPCDIMDENGEKEIPVENGFHLDKDIIGENFDLYDKILILSHFKGHAMGGFGGALKNISIGIASSHGKACARISSRSFSLTIFPPSTCWLNVFKSMDYWWYEKWPFLLFYVGLANGAGLFLVFRVVLGWRFGPVPNTAVRHEDAACAIINSIEGCPFLLRMAIRNIHSVALPSSQA